MGGIFDEGQTSALVFDPGHFSFRAGFAGSDHPSVDIPSIVGCFDDDNQKYVFDHQGIKFPTSNMKLSTFLKDGMIENWDLFEKILNYIYKILGTEPFVQPVLFSESPWNHNDNREKLCELMFEKFNIPAFFIMKDAVLSAFANSRSTCLVLDSGQNQTSVIPVHEGYVIQDSIVRSPLAGEFVTNQCIKYFENNNIKIIPQYMVASKVKVAAGEPANWITRSNLPNNLTMSWKEYMIKDTIHDFKSSALQIGDTTFNENIAKKLPSLSYEFPNGYNIELTSDRFLIPETLFDPSYNKDSNLDMLGISQIASSSTKLCKSDIRYQLFSSVLITGGNTLINGFTDRFSKELMSQVPTSVKCKFFIPTPSERRFSSWIGGSIIASMDSFKMWFTREDYDENGVNGLHAFCP